MPQVYRKRPDSSGFTEPRVLVRIFPEPGQFEQTVRCYESLTASSLDIDVDARELGIRIAGVGAFLIIELDQAQRDRVEQARNTGVTMIFADLEAAIETGLALGAELLTAPFASPVGRGARLRHPDGVIVEYLEHRPGPHDTDAPSL
jgi:hypothetical protein